MMRSLLLLFTLLMVTACSETTAPPPPTMAGTWSGETFGVAFDFTVTEMNQSVSGNGSFRAGNSSTAIKVSGTHVHPDVALTIEADNFEDTAFRGEFVSENRVSGVLDGSGFLDAELVLTRR